MALSPTPMIPTRPLRSWEYLPEAATSRLFTCEWHPFLLSSPYATTLPLYPYSRAIPTITSLLVPRTFYFLLHNTNHRLGIIRSYCYDGAHYGIGLLRYAADRGCARSSYTLGLILRDSYREESKRWLTKAANAGHMPAWQEILPAPEMNSRFGDLDADMLKSYLDPASLNRLLNRHYLKTKSVRTVHTSHCWNPLCGRWAYKATNQTTRDMRERESRNPVPSFLEFLPDLGCCSGCGTGGSGGDCGDGAIGSKNASGATSKPAASDSTVTSGAAAAAAAMVMGSSSRTGAQPGGIDRNSNNDQSPDWYLRVSRMKMCSSCRRAKYCSKLCQVYDWRSGRHKMECQFL